MKSKGKNLGNFIKRTDVNKSRKVESNAVFKMNLNWTTLGYQILKVQIYLKTQTALKIKVGKQKITC